MTSFRPPREGLVRVGQDGYALLRTSSEPGGNSAPILHGHFARFNVWSEINSMYEGNFMERIAPGAFKKTLAENGDNIKVTFNHGHDVLGDQVLGRIAQLREDDQGAYYEVELFRSVPALIMEGLEAGQYGASFRFRVMRETINDAPGASDHNPKGLPERTITEAMVAEFGPVSFPQYPEASAMLAASMRSATDEYMLETFAENPERVKQILTSPARSGLSVTVNGQTYSLDEQRTVSEPEPTLEAEAPSEVRAAEEHPEPERREEPEAQTEPERTEPVDPNSTLPELRSRVGEIGDELQRLDAEAGTGVLDEKQKAEWDSLVAERDELSTQITAKENRMAELERTSAAVQAAQVDTKQTERGFNTITRKTEEDIYDLSTIRNAFDNPGAAVRELKDRARRSIERSHRDFPAEKGTNTEDLQGNVESLLTNAVDPQGEIARRILTTGHPEYADAFWNKLRGRMTSRRQDEILERALGVATAGYAMPYTLDPTVLLTSNGAVNPLRQISRVVQIAGQTWNGVNSAGVTASFDTEASEVSDDTPTLTQPTVSTLKAQAFVPFSIESEQWSDIRNELAREIRDAKDVLEAQKFTLGTGTPEPQGFTVGATNLATTAGSAVIALADIDTLMDSLPPRFQAGAVLVANRKFFSKVRQLSRTAGVNDQWPNVAPGQPGTINGVPAYECSDVSSAITTVAALVAGYGNFQDGFLIVDSIGLNVEYVPTLLHTSNNRPSGQRGLHAYWMTNSVVRSIAPLRILKIGT